MPEITRYGGYTYDNRHTGDELRTLRHENDALRAEVKRLRQKVKDMEHQHRIAGNLIQMGARAVR